MTTQVHQHRKFRLAGIFLVALVTLSFSAQFLIAHHWTWPCLFKAYTGIPCPTCGGTRALAALSQFKIFEALRLNPLIVLGIVVALIFGCTSFRLKEKTMWPVFWGALLLNWVYLICFLPR
jgi:hypothetical protein